MFERVSVQFTPIAPPLKERLELLEGVRSVIQEDGAANRFLVEAKVGSEISRRIFERAVEERWPLAEVTALKPTLEEVFLKLTGEERGVMS
jgi:hypothetical protein